MNLFESAEKLSAAGQEFYRRGWVLGTSGNFSAVVSREPPQVCITAIGNEKDALNESNFLTVDADSAVVSGDGKPSAETMIHLAIYRLRENANSILHTHSVWGTILSDVFYERGAIEIEGYEMLKGFAGVATHEHSERLPVIENSQDYVALAHVVENTLRENPLAHGVYLRRHGLYTWGASIAEAKRHIKIFEFLFEVSGRSLK